jgi:signal transduction histidine kinase
MTGPLPERERPMNVRPGDPPPEGAFDPPYTADVDAAVGALIGAIVAGVAAFWLGRRSAANDLARLREQNRRTEEALGERAEASLEARRVRDRILGSMQDGVILFDGDRRTAFANEHVDELLGARPESLAHVFPVALREAVRRAAESRMPEVAELEIGTPSRWLRATASPAGPDGSVVVVVADVTEARRLDVVRRDFVANASHELKTPVASIQAAAETLLDVWQEDPEAVPRFAGQLEREAIRLSRIVADLLDLSRLESGSELDDEVHLDAIVREETERFADAAETVGLHVHVDAPAVPIVRGSRKDLSLLVRNLLDNAIRYTKAGGTIDAAVGAEDGWVVLRVADTGIGIPTKELPRVFERFYRVDRARSRETGGTGLGLAIVKHVSENHGGSVRVRSELGRGTTFDVRLPRADGV